ncbi:MAG: hypothetical protein ACRDT6_14930 [Micromonosporaceae bacterium]
MSLHPLAPARTLGVLVLAFLTPRGWWWRPDLSRFSGGGGGDDPPRDDRRGRGGDSDWPMWLAILVTTVIAVALSALGIALAVLGGRAPGPYPPGP